ncbi:hypothetical protein [Sediminibacterium ginsengisoli]|uniref:Uncharacterized protein n=1 Tax=Sediminibacterium ginsengisoli TaxID=413434 RepID=A0A1T4Q3T3_9BACT|nr:hypothetical protein [Sediminibacterium ginsengisoli]SJZ98326.1 hypothetical protein SAMN04488132_107130 [Sediminibacterium ginsengisoli]
MRKLIMICLFFITGYTLNAQTNAIEAKAAYLLAEESYGKGDYKKTLEFLSQVREALGNTNCKILYLQIMATRELHAKDSANNDILPLILQFEKSPDYPNFNEEKALEISKLKLLVKSEQKAITDKQAELTLAREKRRDSLAKARTQAHKDAFINTVTLKGQFNITLDELDKANPKWKVKKWVADKVSPTVELYHNTAYSFDTAEFPFPTIPSMKGSHNPFTILGVYVKDGKVTGYQVLQAYSTYIYEGSLPIYNINVGLPVSLANIYSTSLLLDPIITPFTINGATANRYLWTEGKYGFMIEEMHYLKGGGGIVKIVETKFYNPTEKETALYHPSEK